jgi:hypothetical protein
MSRPEFFVRLTRAWQRHWAGIISADQAAAGAMEPELPASVFVHPQTQPAGSDFQSPETGNAERERSASISNTKG